MGIDEGEAILSVLCWEREEYNRERRQPFCQDETGAVLGKREQGFTPTDRCGIQLRRKERRKRIPERGFSDGSAISGSDLHGDSTGDLDPILDSASPAKSSPHRRWLLQHRRPRHAADTRPRCPPHIGG